MSAIQMTCTHCGGRFISGVVGSTPWPKHVCPDGTENAPASFGWHENKNDPHWIGR